MAALFWQSRPLLLSFQVASVQSSVVLLRIASERRSAGVWESDLAKALRFHAQPFSRFSAWSLHKSLGKEKAGTIYVFGSLYPVFVAGVVYSLNLEVTSRSFLTVPC